MLEMAILKVYDIKVVFIIVGLLSEAFMIGEFMRFFHHDFGGTKASFSEDKGILYIPCLFGVIFKNLINLIELKQGMLRIIDYDIEEKTQKLR
mmetsp:Transcript_11795/g.19919  ORF Transcript_11795/g.19919 Transcript_11795/m.19919 type:complete len:93 (+) Transcript_11795:548-826(+)